MRISSYKIQISNFSEESRNLTRPVTKFSIHPFFHLKVTAEKITIGFSYA